MFGENEWKEKEIPINKKFIPKTFKLSFLEKNIQTELSEKENKLLDRYFVIKILMNQWLLLIIQKLIKSLMSFLIR